MFCESGLSGPRYSAALLVAGGAPSDGQLAPFIPQAERQEICWIAADGGCRLSSRYNVELEATIGDFDSAPAPEAGRQIALGRQLHYDRAKDESDRNLALEYLAAQGHRHIAQIGGGGGRSDHFLAMVYDYQSQRLNVVPKLWLTGREAIFYLEEGEELRLSLAIGQLVSTFPLTVQTRLHSQNLQWPLNTVEAFGTSEEGSALPYSLSNWVAASCPNEASGATAVCVDRGSALVFCPFSEQNTSYESACPNQVLKT